MSTVLRLAIQKSGRLSEESIKLIKERGSVAVEAPLNQLHIIFH
jgi:ATP phosphoribosyltransferase